MAERIDITLDDIAAALQYLDCCDTDIWLRAGMAMKSEYGDMAYDTWASWGQGDSRYKEKEALSRWKSFKGSSARGSVSIGTILHWAYERGFKIEKPELTKEQKAAFIIEQEARRAVVAQQAAQDQADIERWYAVVAHACNQLLPHLKKTGNSPYLGKKKISSCGALFAPCSFVLWFKPDFTIDIIVGEKTHAFFADNQNDKAAGIKREFLFFKRGSILIPLWDASHTIQNFQIIYNDGNTKRFLHNGRKSGLWYVIGHLSLDAPIAFVEGFATGASVHMATGWPVVVTFDCGNLPVVAAKWNGYGGDRIKIIAGDNDWETALDPAKKNMGVTKGLEAAEKCGGVLCVPEFAGDATGLSDFNDLHVSAGLDAVRVQLQAAVDHFVESNKMVGEITEGMPPEYAEILVGDYEDYAPTDDGQDLPADNSPEPSFFERPDLEESLKRYALAMPDSKVWDSQDKKLLKQGSVKAFIGQKVFAEWLAHEKRRTVDISDVQRMAAAAQAEGSGGLADALARYIYLFPSSTAWDTQTRSQVALADLRNAIADCYDQWLKHPRRRNVQKENLVFDPTQQVPVGEYINTFKGLPLTPVNNEDLCRNMRHMLWCLCNKDNEIFTWLCCWLAFPLQYVGAKMQTAVLMHSRVHGSGKSFFFDGVMRGVYGEYCKTFGQAELESQYNDWISQALFGVFEEVLSRSQRYSHTGTIKQMITGQKVRINQKYMQGWEESNHMNCVFLSNEVEPLPVEPSDRRLLVIWPEEKLLDQLQTGVDAELKAGGAAAFMGWLLRVDTSGFSEHSKPPMTDAKQRLIDIGRPAWEVFYDDWVNGRTDAPYCACRVLDLYRLYQVWARERNENILASNRFSGYISSYVKKQQDVNYQCGSIVGKASFFIVGECPKGKNKSEWLGGCVAEFDRVLQKSNREAA